MVTTLVVSALDPAGAYNRYSVTNLHPKELAEHEVWVPAAMVAEGLLETAVRNHYQRLNGSLPEDLVVQLP